MNQRETAPLMSERRVSLIGALLVAIGPVSMALFTPAMPELVTAFGTTEAAVKMTISLYFAGFALAQLVCGPLSDGFGRRPVTVAFMGIYLAASLIALFAPTIEVLVAARFMQGIGAAVGVAMSRAIVRDLFTQDRSARIMNLIGMILAIGPAFAPVIGGVTMELFGWHAIFILMVAMGISIVLVAIFGLSETVTRDLSRIRPRALLASYRTLFGSNYFVLCSLIIAGTTGAIYAQATILSFILIDRVGLSPTAFGASMLAQTGMFFTGSVAVRLLMPRLGAFGLVPIGLGFVAIGSALLAALLRFQEPSLLTVMGPVGAYAFGIAFVMPAMTTAAMAPFPKIAGAAASLTGFVQMGSGLLGGMIAAWLGDAVVAMATVIPTMGFTAVIAWFFWRRLPEPVQPVMSPREPIDPPVAQ
jgi:DHA1 family bicyclomycin/chloramphenicol resistance-like MFS transporter